MSTDIIRTLQEREWVRQVGVRDVPGKPALFATTRSFLEYFNLEGLSQLPSLQDIRDMDTIAAELNMKLPLVEGNNEGDDNEAGDEVEGSSTENNPQTDLLDNTDNARANDEDFPAEGVSSTEGISVDDDEIDQVAEDASKPS